MTWLRNTEGLSVPVSAEPFRAESGERKVKLQVQGSFAFLSEEDAASLGGYLMGSTNNDDSDKEVTD